MHTLGRRSRDVLNVLCWRQRLEMTTSLRELCDSVGWRSKGRAEEIVSRLVRLGLVSHERRRARTLLVTAEGLRYQRPVVGDVVLREVAPPRVINPACR